MAAHGSSPNVGSFIGAATVRVYAKGQAIGKPDAAELEAIDRRLDGVALLAADERRRNALREALDGVRDLERLGAKAAAKRATPRDHGGLRDSCARLPGLHPRL